MWPTTTVTTIIIIIILLQIVEALSYLHDDHNIAHGNLKPRSIYVQGDTVKVGDFGLCKSFHNALLKCLIL